MANNNADEYRMHLVSARILAQYLYEDLITGNLCFMKNTHQLAEFIANLRYEDIPLPVIERMKALVIDWFGSALGGQYFYPTDLFRKYSTVMGPQTGTSTIFGEARKTSPYFAALVNGASGHLLEQDDLHNSSVFHPATVVFPALLAAGEDLAISGRDFLLGAIAGYEAGIRIGEFLGRSHYRVFHTTSTVGAISAAIAVGKLMSFNVEQILSLIGNSATQSAGLWAFLEDGADSKQLHTAKANANGILAAYMTREGLKGAKNPLESLQGMAKGMSIDSNPARLNDGLSTRWATLETSLKYHASCRHTHPAADALLQLLTEHNIHYSEVASVTAYVHQAAIDVLGPVTNPQTVHQAKFSMGTVLGLLAVHGKAGLYEFSEFALNDTNVKLFSDKVIMKFDPTVDMAYPKQWQGKVEVLSSKGEIFKRHIHFPKGDPENPLSNKELEEKFEAIIAFSGDNNLQKKSADIINCLWELESLAHISQLIKKLS